MKKDSGKVTPSERAALLKQRPLTVWLTGLSAAGKSTIAEALERALANAKRPCFMLDGDALRAGLTRDLGFAAEHRRENIRRAGEVARLMNDAGVIVVAAFISPYRADREMARSIIGAERFLEVYVRAPLEVCERRDPKGLYRRARQGEIPDFTGVSAPYEAPEAPDVMLDSERHTVAQCVAQVLATVMARTSPQ